MLLKTPGFDAQVTAAAARARGCSVHTGGPATYVRCDRIDSVIETRQMNLERLDAAIFEGRHLVSASALLDLVSESWLRVLATRCHAAGAAALFAVTYNGGSSCDPAEPEDEMVRELMNLHQRTDKGLGGPAAGPDAAAVTKRVFEEIMQGGYVAQRMAAPGERMVCAEGAEPQPLKCDVRCYVYEGRVQLVVARLYQGQTTNFRTQGGGFAPVRVVE